MNEIARDDLIAIRSDIHTECGEPDWSLLDDRRGNLPEFPEHVLSPAVADYIERASHGAGVTFAHVAVPLLSIASGVIGTARRIEASRSFVQPMAFWAAIVGSSGTGKTPGLGVTIRALAEIERLQKERGAELQRQHETKAEAAKAALAQWKKAVEEAMAGGMPTPPKPLEATAIGPFVRPRMYVSDVTIERVAALVQARPAGLPVVVDELAGLFANMSRYSQGSDREFWLQSWNAMPYTVERMGREPIILDRLLCSLTGGFQPDKLATAFDGDNDGMYARLCFSWPSETGYRPLSDDVSEVEPEIVNAFGKLQRLTEPVDGVFAPKNVRLSGEAARRLESFREWSHKAKAGLDDREAECWSKGVAQALRIAGTLALLEWAWSDQPQEPSEIGDQHLSAAIVLWRDYFWPHSRAAVRLIGANKRRSNERRVLVWLRSKQLDQVSVKDIRRELFGHTLNAKDSEALLNALEAAGWLRKRRTETGGRPITRWHVNPVLYAESAESAESVSALVAHAAEYSSLRRTDYSDAMMGDAR